MMTRNETCYGLGFFITLIKIVTPFILCQIVYLWIFHGSYQSPVTLEIDKQFIKETNDRVQIGRNNTSTVISVNISRSLNGTYINELNNHGVHRGHTEPAPLPTTRSINRSYVDEIKAQLAAAVDTHGQFILSQSNVKIGQSIHYAINRDKTQKIDKSLHKLLPRLSPFSGTHFNRCSVVGSGGILLNSTCGKEIDMADYVFRCNAPPVKMFTVDAGLKTNLTTINQSTAWRRFNGLKSKKDKSEFIRFMQDEETNFLLPVLSIKSGYYIGKKILETMSMAKNPPLQVYSIHPQHFTSTQQFWKSKGLLNRLSTGFYLTSAAISLCDEVHLYGFWPFTKDMNGNQIPYHYYDKQKFAEKQVHNFTTEFLTLSKLHSAGIINLHVHPCGTTTTQRTSSILDWIYTQNDTIAGGN